MAIGKWTWAAVVVAPVWCGAAGCASTDHNTASIVFVGDTAFGERYQERRARRGQTNVLGERGYDYPLGQVAPLLDDANVVFANLETSLHSLEQSPFEGEKTYIHQGEPVRTTETLRRHGVSVVSLANNHAMDYGAEGLAETTAALDGAGLLWIGAGPDLRRAARAFAFTLDVGERQVRIAVVAGFEVRRSYAEEYGYYATTTTPGVNGWTPETAGAQIRALRAHEPEALIVAYPHWGSNYEWRTARQVAIAHALVDAGADLVIGHGAHTIQEIERYRDRWIIYNLGNFVFLSDGRYERTGAAPYGIVARIVIGDGPRPDIHLDLTPILSNNLATEFQPRPVDRDVLRSVHTLLVNAGPEDTLLDSRLRVTDNSLRLKIGSGEHGARWGDSEN